MNWNIWFVTLSIFFLLVLVQIVRIGFRYHKADWGRPWLNCIQGLNRFFCLHYHRLDFEDIPLPDKGPAIVVANHISGLDPLLLLAASPRPLRFMIAREEYKRFWLRWIASAMGAIPVDRQGRPEKAMREAISALKSGEVIAMFPHGKIIDPNDDRPQIKSGAIRLSQQVGCGIYPVFLDGIKAKGRMLFPIVLRARAKLAIRDTLVATPEERAFCNECLAQLLNNRPYDVCTHQ